jgi:tetratricopeptide (TPR) repeat protein
MQNAECKMQELKCAVHAHRAVFILHYAFLAFVVLIATGCDGGRASPSSVSSGGSSAATTPIDRHSLRPVSFPDVSGATPSAQKQLREANVSLDATIQNTGVSDVILGKAYGQTGTLLLAAEYRQAAEPYLLNAQALDPMEIRWPYFLAHLYRLRGESANAIVWFERSLQLQPDSVATLVWLGDAYLDQGRPADAEPLLMKVLSQQPRSVPALFGLGRVALARQDYGRAIDYLEQALAIDQHATLIHYSLAMAYRGAGNLERAEAHLKQRGPGQIRPPDPLMMELDTVLESAVAYEVRGARALDEGKWAEAAGYFRKGIELAPDEPSYRHKLGTALAMMGDGQGAFEQFELVASRWPNFAKGQYSLGVMLASSGRQREAVERFAAAVKADPTYVEPQVQMAETLRAMGRFQDALAAYDRAIKLDPRVAEARLGAAMALAGLRRYGDARDRLTEGMKLFPERSEFAQALASLPQ